MLEYRIIPSLLLSNGGLVKTTKFKNPNYVGDPINVVKIFNAKLADELVLLDIGVSKKNQPPNFKLLNRIAKEAFMPMGYGGGIKKISEIAKIFRLGYEKVIINNHALTNPEFITEAANNFGSQSIVVGIDVKKDFLGRYFVYDHVKKKRVKLTPVELAKKAEMLGAGELIIYSVDNDGVMKGYDLSLIEIINKSVDIPVVALGGAGSVEDLIEVLSVGNSVAAGAGSIFIYRMPHKAVLISYPDRRVIKEKMEIYSD
ncbi:AglZ/HisF2 family acetamidino modification protein [Gracilimonas sp.]|uniref:AglZ/HisF2 family acetamidino modification protein n=1 Tax=Gracilimonas sp. TaxID=1974203 RepID=UPI0032EC91EF